LSSRTSSARHFDNQAKVHSPHPAPGLATAQTPLRMAILTGRSDVACAPTV